MPSKETNVRIAFYGNVANNFYQMARALRLEAAVDAHVFIHDGSHPVMLPESDDPSLLAHYPKWIHKGPYVTQADYFEPWKARLIQELEPFDIIVVSELGPLFTQFIKKPTVFHVTGGDLTLYPFPWRFRARYVTDESKKLFCSIGRWQRRGLRRITEIWSAPYAPYQEALQRLRIAPDRVAPTVCRLIIDTTRFAYRPPSRPEPHAIRRHLAEHYDFVVFHPARLMMDTRPELIATGQWKQNDLFFRGFADFLKRSGARRAVLVMPDRTDTPEVQAAKRLLQELGIQHQVLWIAPTTGPCFTRDEMIHLYSASDVVADDFGVGWFGSVAVEALAISRPLITYVDERVMRLLYPWHPMLSARTAPDISDLLLRLYLQPEWRRQVGTWGRRWVEEFHSERNAAQVYVRPYVELAARLGLDARARAAQPTVPGGQA